MRRNEWKTDKGFKVMWQCRRKLAHDNYLTAILHAARIQKSDPKIPYETYICEHCGMIHVGRFPDYQRLVTRMKNLNRVLSNPEFQKKAPLEIKELFNSRHKELQRLLYPLWMSRKQ